ncbi:MAG: Metal-dependent hydrolase YbeY, involved in rRNA and/or ribosome maturation and assembly [uncultured Sulfurovum sp.]|uniref:Endoribonuclease YbeY n=1 Tax=uncultured Sulfurovum sp. TaxID=269237 RepID=A0A6S6UBL8_9BACT|nr:MAG: Metal-dependent hydrolase YbeY, involved in rRNA and/or ribosome maturation and assembly [uncultured Sulfurovum sp.]
MIDLDNQSTLHINIEQLEEIASTLSQHHVELIVTNDKTIQALNVAHRGKDSATDVLSFPMDITSIPKALQSEMPLGSIVISENYVEKKALEYGHKNDDELALLFIHGMLHLLGFDHEVDNGEMRAKEKELIEQFHLPKSLIIRNEEN